MLEAIFLVGRGRSFRTRHTEQLIARGASRLQRLRPDRSSRAHRIGFEYRRDESYTARLDGAGRPAAWPSCRRAFFVEVIDPEVHRLVEGAPGERRRWLDWGVFHVEHGFLEHWVRYSRALRQRNAALKQGGDAEPLGRGDRAARGAGAPCFGAVVRIRAAVLAEAVRTALWTRAGRGAHFRGWAAERSLAEALADGLERDRARGSTLAGPQRADVHLRVGGKAARESLSRGQQKLVAAAMVLALLQRLREQQSSPPTLLLDDPAAELDRAAAGCIWCIWWPNWTASSIITSLDPDLGIFGTTRACVSRGTRSRSAVIIIRSKHGVAR